jgi:hypothetical protein
MTAQELIKHLQSYDPNAVIAYDLWQTEDVIHAGRDRFEPVEVTQEQAEEVIRLMDHNKDCNIGLNWDVMNYHLDEVLSDSK